MSTAAQETKPAGNAEDHEILAIAREQVLERGVPLDEYAAGRRLHDEIVASPQPSMTGEELLAARRNSLHDAHHEAMECLGQMLWESQRAGRPPDGQAYVECVQRRATK